MNMRPETGSHWKGRVLFHITIEDTEKPIKKVVPMDPEVRKKARKANITEQIDYQLTVDVGQGVAMPDDEYYSLRFSLRGG